jgi:hypothetical protein
MSLWDKCAAEENKHEAWAELYRQALPDDEEKNEFGHPKNQNLYTFRQPRASPRLRTISDYFYEYAVLWSSEHHPSAP